MSDIFLSYKREDQAIARRIADVLQLCGWSVWWDPKLRAGERIDDVIDKALETARCVLVLWSRTAITSAYVRDEASYALRAKKLVPAFIETVELPFRFAGIHTIDLVPWVKENTPITIAPLLRAIDSAVLDTPGGNAPSLGAKPDMTFAEAIEIQRHASASLQLGARWTNTISIDFAFIPAGKFYLPAPKDRRHEVVDSLRIRIARPFWLSTNIVGRDAWRSLMKTEPWQEAPNLEAWSSYIQEYTREILPAATYVTWDEALEFCACLAEVEGRNYQLPSDVEWEYACRAGSYNNERDNPWGLESMLCSNQQWCATTPLRGEERSILRLDQESTEPMHVACGGLNDRDGFYYGADKRHQHPLQHRHLDLGFRVKLRL